MRLVSRNSPPPVRLTLVVSVGANTHAEQPSCQAKGDAIQQGRSPGSAARACSLSGRMLEGKRVAVVVPAYNEERLIAETITGIPAFVDRIYVVDDHSSDGTAEAARALRDPQVEVIVHEQNEGVGAAIV